MPEYYGVGGIETIDFIKAKLTEDEYRGFLKGNIIKYVSRSSWKGEDDSDYFKCVYYARLLSDL